MTQAPQAFSDVAALYDEAPCGLLVTTPEGVIQRVNGTFCAWVGHAAGDLIGRQVQTLLTIGGRIFHQTHWSPLMEIQGSVSEVKLELVHRDGRRLPTVWNAVRRVRDGVDRHELAVFMAEDRHRYEVELLQARRRAEELLAREREARAALRDAQEERDRLQALAEDRALFAEQMVAIVSHDLRNPLTVVRLTAELIARGDLSERQASALGRLKASNERAIRLIFDLLDFSRRRLGKGLLPVEPSSLDLHALVRDAVAELRVGNPGHVIEHRFAGSGLCLGNGDRLTQLIGNLVANAVAYGSPHGPVVVASIIANHEFSIAVHNGGPAIPPALLPALFDPMIRGNGDDNQATSIGLGLFIVREIALGHGGRVGVVSTPSAGTTFTATFPR